MLTASRNGVRPRYQAVGVSGENPDAGSTALAWWSWPRSRLAGIGLDMLLSEPRRRMCDGIPYPGPCTAVSMVSNSPNSGRRAAEDRSGECCRAEVVGKSQRANGCPPAVEVSCVARDRWKECVDRVGPPKRDGAGLVFLEAVREPGLEGIGRTSSRCVLNLLTRSRNEGCLGFTEDRIDDDGGGLAADAADDVRYGRRRGDS